MSEATPILSLPYILPAQAQKHITHNEALRDLDALVQMRVEQLDAETPPSDPASGEIYGLGSNPSDAWAGQGGRLAVWDGTAWDFLVPQEGWRTWAVAEAAFYVFSQGIWRGVTPPLQNLDGVGVGTSWDAVNRLAVASEATLLSHGGAGHQLKVNKATESDTASLLFQSNFTGHAEMGLAGDTTFRVKVSADGATFRDGLAVRPDDGVITTPGLASARLTLIPDSAADIPTPGAGGIVTIAVVGQTDCAGVFAFDTGAAPSLGTLSAGPAIDALGDSALDGTTGGADRVSIAVGPGVLRLENRLSAPAEVAVTYLSVF